MFEGFKSHLIVSNGVSISAVSAGHGPAVLLLHGFPQTKALWSQIAPELARDHTVVVADLRGYGDSGKPMPLPDAANYSFREMALDMVGVMQSLGHEKFHLIGHDRGARVAHRLTQDHSERVQTLALLDIVPTHTVFHKVDRHLAKAYWHWFLLSQPAPFPENTILSDPDRFFEVCLTGWGKAGLSTFPADALADYRQHWRDPDCIAGMCADYRAAALVDILHDEADFGRKIAQPTLIYYGADGVMGRMFDMGAEWAPFAENTTVQSCPGGHFFVDEHPAEVAAVLGRHLSQQI